MIRSLQILRAGPGLTIQDLGRPGWHAYGVSNGGAVDRMALYEGAALLGQTANCAALEMPTYGGDFLIEGDCRIALTGAPMVAQLDGVKLVWNASHKVTNGQRLSIGAATTGVYGYLSVSGGFQTPEWMGSRSAHLAANIGGLLSTGDRLPVGDDPNEGGMSVFLPERDRFSGGDIRVVTTLHTSLFSNAEVERFTQTNFQRSLRSNRQGAALTFDGLPFTPDAGQTILSEPMIMGDIQMTGDGYPFVLQSECQTAGGFARIAQVLPCDLSTVAQATPDRVLRFRFVTFEEADLAYQSYLTDLKNLRGQTRPLLRRVEDIRDLLSYQLISGAVTGWETDMPEDCK